MDAAPDSEDAIAALKAWDVPYLDVSDSGRLPARRDPAWMAAALIVSSAPRVRLAVTAFYLKNPGEAASVQSALPVLQPKAALLLKYYYTAAVYLEQYWRSALNRSGQKPLPDLFSRELGLPSPQALHGRFGLYHLEEKLRLHAGEALDFRSSFEAIALLQIKPAAHA